MQVIDAQVEGSIKIQPLETQVVRILKYFTQKLDPMAKLTETATLQGTFVRTCSVPQMVGWNNKGIKIQSAKQTYHSFHWPFLSTIPLGHEDRVWQVAWSPSGNILASCSGKYQIKKMNSLFYFNHPWLQILLNEFSTLPCICVITLAGLIAYC